MQKLATTALAATFAGMIGTSAFAAVITNPAVGVGATAINPDGQAIEYRDTAAASYAAEATLTGQASFRTLQGLDGTSTATNIFDFTDPNFPDIRFFQSGGNQPGTNQASDNGTSASNGSYPFQPNNTTATLTITFGTYDAVNTLFTANRTVDATSLTINNLKNVPNATLTFFDAAGVSLGSQTLSYTSTSSNQTSYFGTDLNGIRSMVLSVTQNNTDRGWVDDVGFTVIPEPSSLALLGLGGLLMLRRRIA